MELALNRLLTQDVQDEIIIFQTDTVYGVGCLLDSEKGIEKLYRLKRREATKPLAVLCADYRMLSTLVVADETLKALADAYWPGPLTCVVEKSARVPDTVTRGRATVGVRIPADHTAQAILRRFGPMAVTSLNPSGAPEIIRYREARAFLDDVDYLVKGKDLAGPASTVVDVGRRMTLRQGVIDVDWTRIDIK